MQFKERVYIIEILKGLRRTLGHLVHNLLHQREMPTLRYPEEKRIPPPRFRGRHRLTQKDDGSLKCTACFLCATACPAKCIYIEAQDGLPEGAEKFPRVYNLDMLKCVHCGLCVEACPCDAIRMDTGLHPAPADSREKFIYTIKELTTYPELKNPYPPRLNRCGKL